MDKENNIRKEIQQRAERLMHYNELLIQQCDSWLSAEEGNRNMMEAFEKRRRAEKRTKQNERWRRWKRAIARLFKPMYSEQ
jgi:hypothetical protein